MASYDIKHMREDAIRRAREMYSRANPSAVSENTTQATEEKPINETLPPEEEKSDNLNEDFLQSFFKDKERMLILALLVILSQEEGNNSLLFALMYLLI
ncbi:MAG: hypothetical protein R3Y33_08300 [Clostridia bacterium]